MLKEIQERRSIRAYRPDPVPVDFIETVLLAGSLALYRCTRR